LFPSLYHFFLRHAYASPYPANAALWLNWFYLALLCAALFGLAWHFRPDETAALCVVIFVGSPAVQELLHTQLLDISLVAWAAAAYWAFLRSEDFQRWAGSLACAAFCVLGMLHDWRFVSYILPLFYVGLKAMSRASSLVRVLAAALVALAGVVPWYWTHRPVLTPGLFLAPVAASPPVRGGMALLSYLPMMAEGLGLPFFLLSLVGICVPQYRRDWQRGWVLGAWIVSSYIFWGLVPDSRFRYLLPGLPALAVAGLGAWPKIVLWGLAFLQLFTMANFTSGWLLPISVPVPLHSVTVFPSQPPAGEDWKIATILEEAEKLSDPERPIAGLTLVANDERFNIDSFRWTARLLRLPRVRIRSARKRLYELSEFVLLKDGRLGPPGTISGLEEISADIKAPKGWFRQGFDEVRRWPLPDGTAAVLYQQKLPAQSPVKERRLDFQYYESGDFSARNLSLELGDWDARRGVYRTATLSAADLKLGGWRLSDLRLDLEGVLFVPLYDAKSNAWDDVRLLRLDGVRVSSLRLSGETLRAALEARCKALHVAEFALDRTLKVRSTWGPLSLSAEFAAQLMSAPAGLRLDLLGARLGATPVQGPPSGPIQSWTQPLTPTTELPFSIQAPSLTIAGGWVSVP
jgi:hypothetical protein